MITFCFNTSVFYILRISDDVLLDPWGSLKLSTDTLQQDPLIDFFNARVAFSENNFVPGALVYSRFKQFCISEGFSETDIVKVSVFSSNFLSLCTRLAREKTNLLLDDINTDFQLVQKLIIEDYLNSVEQHLKTLHKFFINCLKLSEICFTFHLQQLLPTTLSEISKIPECDIKSVVKETPLSFFFTNQRSETLDFSFDNFDIIEDTFLPFASLDVDLKAAAHSAYLQKLKRPREISQKFHGLNKSLLELDNTPESLNQAVMRFLVLFDEFKQCLNTLLEILILRKQKIKFIFSFRDSPFFFFHELSSLFLLDPLIYSFFEILTDISSQEIPTFFTRLNIEFGFLETKFKTEILVSHIHEKLNFYKSSPFRKKKL